MVCKNLAGILLLLLASVSSSVFSQEKPAASGIKLSMQHYFDGAPLVLNDRFYKNAAGDSFSVSMYKYYISNIKLVRADGSEYAVEDSYHLVNEGRRSSKEFAIDVPEGSYTAMRFLIGVDSLHNVSGAQDGALDPVNAMFWDWRTGYIMAKMEGNLKNQEQTQVSYHIGGFADTRNTLRWVTFRFPQPVAVKQGKTPVVRLKSDLAEWFKIPFTVEFEKMPVVVAEGADAVRIADNYADMFTLDDVVQ